MSDEKSGNENQPEMKTARQPAAVEAAKGTAAAEGANQEIPAETNGSEGAGGIPALPDFTGMLEQAAAGSIELLKDVELTVKIELGRCEMAVNDILTLTSGSVVELDKLAGDPVDVLANEQLIARGEVLVLNDNFCVRINEIIPGVTERVARA